MYKNILLPVDSSDLRAADKYIKVAVGYAKAFDSTLHVMTVIPDASLAIVHQYFSNKRDKEIVDATEDALKSFTEKNFPKGLKVKHIVTTGTVYESIIGMAKKLKIDLIVMSAHRPELKDYLLGPNSARVVRHSDKSVLVVRD